MPDPLAKLRDDCGGWSDEYLAGQYSLGPSAYSTEAAWKIVRSEYERRGLKVEAIAQDKDSGGEAPRDNTSFAANRLAEGKPYDLVTAALIERGLDERKAKQLVRQLAVERREAARQSARRGLMWCAGGFAVTIGTYFVAAPGETYVVAWGAVVFGAIQAFRGWHITRKPLPEPDPKTFVGFGQW